MPRACDELLIQKLYSSHKDKNVHFIKPRLSRSAFGIRHYAGVVVYEGEGFVDKNGDSVCPEHISLLKASEVRGEMAPNSFLTQSFCPPPFLPSLLIPFTHGCSIPPSRPLVIPSSISPSLPPPVAQAGSGAVQGTSSFIQTQLWSYRREETSRGHHQTHCRVTGWSCDL